MLDLAEILRHSCEHRRGAGNSSQPAINASQFHLTNYVTAPSAEMKNTVHLGDFYTSKLLSAVANLMGVKPTR
jgi:hypothetical protein